MSITVFVNSGLQSGLLVFEIKEKGLSGSWISFFYLFYGLQIFFYLKSSNDFPKQTKSNLI
jgi:hypothetical protein